MSADERGPSWYDAAVAVRELAEVWGVAVELAVVPNWRIDDRARLGSWVVAVRVGPREGRKGPCLAASRSFGARADSKTAPGAILVCTTRLWAQLDEAQRLAEAQATF